MNLRALTFTLVIVAVTVAVNLLGLWGSQRNGELKIENGEFKWKGTNKTRHKAQNEEK